MEGVGSSSKYGLHWSSLPSRFPLRSLHGTFMEASTLSSRNRYTSKPHEYQNYGGEQSKEKAIPQTNGGIYWEKWGQSFATVVKDKLKVDDSEITKIYPSEEVMNLEGKHSDNKWLEFSAVGVLKVFRDVSSMVIGMLNRGIKFNFYFLGDKNVLRLFQSKKDKEDFIRNKVLWSEFFSSVREWSPAITPQSRMTWVEFRGIPLDCWCEDFFRRLGWAVGEPLRIDEATVKRNNIVVGRVLVLIPYNHPCPKVVNVSTGRRFFQYKFQKTLR
ncbi:hypothetical protein Dsin_021822 [Dipteronia sinensis]|uniref:DUF4283 domain-containing protein n=1 Tax=Dipteronia sinensis TaxID=43782 RepID=A0AAE0A193_9ROSI|nr:hypothetical protein Dsin_021822 [Dipteronia sinensis]